MPRLKSANNASTTLAVSITNSTTSFTVANSSAFPDAPFRITVDAEIMEVGAINKVTHTFSAVLRAQEGTTAASHTSGTTVENRWTAGTYDELLSSSDAIEDAQIPSTIARDSELSAHTALTNTAHGATSAATASTTMARDSAGRAKVAAPSASDDIARKAETDAALAAASAAQTTASAAQTTANAALPASSYTAADILTKLKTVDGSGSGLDADTVDGVHGSQIVYGDVSTGNNQWTTGANNITKSGFYYISTDLTNLPIAGNGYILHHQYTTGYATQKFNLYYETVSYQRVQVAGTWGEWVSMGGNTVVGKKRTASGSTFTNGANGTYKTLLDISGVAGRIELLQVVINAQVNHGGSPSYTTGSGEVRITIDGAAETYSFAHTTYDDSGEPSTYYTIISGTADFLNNEEYWRTNNSALTGIYTENPVTSPIYFNSSLKVEIKASFASGATPSLTGTMDAQYRLAAGTA